MYIIILTQNEIPSLIIEEFLQKIKELGLEYSTRQYIIQVALFAGIAGVIGYLYFYNIIVVIVYVFWERKQKIIWT